MVNTGSGLGFGIIGGQQPGVIVKTILPGGVADADGRLRAGDFILQINEHWLQGVGSDKVANVLRGTGNHVRLIVARDPIQSKNFWLEFWLEQRLEILCYISLLTLVIPINF